MTEKFKMLINGALSPGAENKEIASINPYTEKAWAHIPVASKADVDQAVIAANNAFKNDMKQYSGLERANLLLKLAEILENNVDVLAEIETKDNGKVLRENKNQILFAARQYRFFAGYADKIYGDTIPLDNVNLFNYTVKEPLGVVGLITSWNSSLYSLANKLAPALATGNTVVIKPSELASASILKFGEWIQEVDFPKGLINIVSGGGEVGEWISTHPEVKKVSFTGGVSTGIKISKSTSEDLTPATLELGGKSPHIIFETANIDKAVTGAIAGIFGGSGQSCIAGSRLLVQKSIYDDVINKIMESIKNINIGNPLEADTDMGPIANERQYDHIVHLIKEGEKEGANLVNKDWINAQQFEQGYFVPPTIFTDVNNDMTIARTEFFGPVLCVIPFDTEKEAIEIANDTEFGLAAGLWTQDITLAHQVAKELDAGTVWINTYRSTAVQAPFGGYKKSGIGKERGYHALSEYLNTKNIMLDLGDGKRDPFTMSTK